MNFEIARRGERATSPLPHDQAILESYHQACLAVTKGEECPVLVDLDSGSRGEQG